MFPNYANTVAILRNACKLEEETFHLINRTFSGWSVISNQSNFVCSRNFSKQKRNNALLSVNKIGSDVQSNSFQTTIQNKGRYGHRLVKLWEQKEYTTEPLKVYRTGGRLPVENWKGTLNLLVMLC